MQIIRYFCAFKGVFFSQIMYRLFVKCLFLTVFLSKMNLFVVLMYFFMCPLAVQ